MTPPPPPRRYSHQLMNLNRMVPQLFKYEFDLPVQINLFNDQLPWSLCLASLLASWYCRCRHKSLPFVLMHACVPSSHSQGMHTQSVPLVRIFFCKKFTPALLTEIQIAARLRFRPSVSNPNKVPTRYKRIPSAFITGISPRPLIGGAKARLAGAFF